MPESFLSPPIKEGILPEIGPHDQLIFLGGDRLLAWNSPTGHYRIWRIGLSRAQGTIVDASLYEGIWEDRTGHVLVWLGGDQLLDYNPGTGEYTGLHYDRTVVGDKPFSALAAPEKHSLPPHCLLTYLGRDRLLVVSLQGKSQLFDTARLLKAESLAPPPKPQPFHFPSDCQNFFTGPKIAEGDLRVVWLGGDRLAVWDSKSGEGCGGRYREGLVPMKKFPSDLQECRMMYIGQNCVLAWQPGTERSWINEVLLQAYLNPGLDDYLELHHNVRDAITWQHDGQLLTYKEWDLYPSTALFYAALAKFYNSIAVGSNVPFVFQADPNQTIAPLDGIAPGQYPGLGPGQYPGQVDDYYIGAIDAAQIFLAHVAQSLWVELTRQVAWPLHSFSDSQLVLLLGSDYMFTEGLAANNKTGFYAVNYDCCGNGTPGDPTKSYRFLTGTDVGIRNGPSMIKNTICETIFELFRWLRDHLRHCLHSGGTEGLAAYGYAGYPPIEKMFTKVTDPWNKQIGPRYHAWWGCHSAAALVVWLTRTINIPCCGHWTYIDQYPLHHGIDFPSQRLFSAHTDDFYAISKLIDPTIEPSEVFEPEPDYDAMKQNYLTAPAPGEDPLQTYNRAMAHKALAHPTFYYVDLYWYELIYPGSSSLSTELAQVKFDAAEVQALRAQYVGKLQAAIDSFKQQQGLQNAPEATARTAYEAANDTWRNNR
jgi:hypothetical protein